MERRSQIGTAFNPIKLLTILKILLLSMILGTLIMKKDHSDKTRQLVDYLQNIYCNVSKRSIHNE